MIWDFIIGKLTETHRVFLLLVLESKGSSPGRQGFKMAVASDGSAFGSVGGGIMEHKFVELVRSRMQTELERPSVHLQVHSKDSTSRSGMICSGEQTLYLKELLPEEISILHQISESWKYNRGEVLEISDQGTRLIKETGAPPFYFQRCGEESFIYREKTGKKNILHVVGGGHCSLALCRLMYSMDFIINVYDDRLGLNTIEQNKFADNKMILSSYSDLADHIKGGDNVYVIIMTFGYRTDDLALRSIIEVPVKYIGMIGSQKKISQLFENYLKENINAEILKRLNAPAGLQIKSETPEEIAVSIAGEMIRIKNTGQ